MSDRRPRSVPVLLFSLGCGAESQTLTSLVDRWTDDTVEISEPALTDALVVAGLAVELCGAIGVIDWSAVEVGDLPPLSEGLGEALGSPLVDEVEVFGGGAMEVTLSGVVVVDREEALLRFVTTPYETSFSLEAVVLDARLVEDDQPEGEPFGRLAYEVVGGCDGSRSTVSGTARWTDLDGRTHTVRLPADDTLSFGVGFASDVPWLPVTGTVAWSSRISGQERTVTTFDATDITIEDAESSQNLPTVSWPSVVSGPDWVSQRSIEIAPGD